MIYYDMLRMTNKPRLVEHFYEYTDDDKQEDNTSLIGVSHPELTPTFLGTAGFWHKKGKLPTQYRVLKSIFRMWNLICTNPEAFPSGPPLVSVDLEQKQVTAKAAAQALLWIKEEFPHMPITCYAPQFAPWRQYWNVFQWLIIQQERTEFRGYEWFKRIEQRTQRFSKKYAAWQKRNEETKFVQDICDVVTVSLYPGYYEDFQIRERWAIFAQHMIRTAENLWPQKKIAAWVWNRVGKKYQYKEVSKENFQFMMDTLRAENVHGIGVWGSKHDDWRDYEKEYWPAIVGKKEEPYEDYEGEEGEEE